MAHRRRKQHKRRHEVVIWGHLSIVNALDWLLMVMLMGTMSLVTFQLGGVFAETQLISIWLLGGCIFINSLRHFVEQKEGGVGINIWSLAFIPFLLYLLLNLFFVSSVPWAGRTNLWIFIQAGAVVWLFVNGFMGIIHLWFAFAVLLLVALINVFLAFSQYFRGPGQFFSVWKVVDFGRQSLAINQQLADGVSGTFASSASFAAFMLLAFFTAAIAAFCRHLAPSLRWFCGYLAFLFLIALGLSMERGALLALLPCALLLPWFTRVKGKRLVYGYALVIAVGILWVSLFLVYSEAFRGLWLGNDSFALESTLWNAAWQNFMSHAVFGNGLGTYPYLFESFRLAGFNVSPDFVGNDYLQILSELGVIGFILLFAPVILGLLYGFSAWREYPDLELTEEKKHGRHVRKMPEQKLFLGTTILALLALGLHLFWASDLQVLAVALWAALLLGIMLRQLPVVVLPISDAQWLKLPVFILACVFAIGIPLLSTNGYVAEIYATQGEYLGELMAARTQHYHNNAELLEQRIDVLQSAVDKNPRHADGHAQLASALSDQKYIKPTERVSIGSQAELHARDAIEVYPNEPMYWIYLGDSLSLQGRDAETNSAYQQALELAPNNAWVWYHYANWLQHRPEQREDALYAIDRALSLNPDNPKAEAVRKKILIP